MSGPAGVRSPKVLKPKEAAMTTTEGGHRHRGKTSTAGRDANVSRPERYGENMAGGQTGTELAG